MDDTPKSLLQRVRNGSTNADWKRLTDLYTPFLRRIVQDSGLSDADREDLLQDVFTVVVREIGAFVHNEQRGAFRRWLRTIAMNRLRGLWRSKATHRNGPHDPEILLVKQQDSANDLERLWDQEHDAWVARRLLELLEPEFTVSTWQAFRRQVVDGVSAGEVARELGMTANAVLIAKSRVLRRLREEVAGLID
jgi:RNA polymerase sigma-70 factor (ECF subfamily)